MPEKKQANLYLIHKINVSEELLNYKTGI